MDKTDQPIKALIKKIEQKQDLSIEESEQFIEQMIDESTTDSTIEEALLAYSQKEPVAQELIGFLKFLRSKKLNIKVDEDTVDNCGTGGSGMLRINTSTLASFVAAAGGVKMAKHGNKAASGRCGSFDVLEAAGVNIQLNPNQAQQAYDQLGLTYLYAPLFHPVMKRVAQARKKIETYTIFNILGPLSNPAQVKRQVIGVSQAKYVPLIIEALQYFEAQHVVLVRGDYGLDELTVTGASQIWDIKGKQVDEYSIHPKDFGVEPCKMAYIKGGDIEYNRRVFFSVLENKDREYRTEQVLFNAAAALYVAGKADSILKAYPIAQELLASKKAHKKFIEYRDFSNQ